MKIKEITLNNFAKYDQVTVSFDDNVTYLIGKNGSGKSTLGITAIWFMFQGIAEKSSGGNSPLIGERFRFIGPKAATAKGEMILHDEKTGADIKVMRKLTKSGTDLSFEAPPGYELGQQWLTDLFNIFLISPKKFCDLSPKDQAKALGIDTKKFDDEIADLKKKYTEINAVYRSFGDLPEVEKVEKVDLTELQAKKEQVRLQLNEMYIANKARNKQVEEARDAACDEIDRECNRFNNEQINLENLLTEVNAARKVLEDAGYDGMEVVKWIDTLGKPQEHKSSEQFYPPAIINLWEQPEGYEPKEGEFYFIKELPDDTELKAIDQQIIDAGETNNKALLYEQYLQKKAQKETKEKELKANKDAQTAKENERLEYIKSFKFPFSNLSVGEDGELLLNGKPIKQEYFSTGELLKIIPVLIATTQPELKYVFLQDFNLMDEDKQKEIEEYLTGKGFQLVVEVVGKKKLTDKNCILLRDNCIVDNYEEDKTEMPI